MKAKKVIAALLIGCMVFSMTACMNKGGGTNSSKSGKRQEKVEAPKEPLGKYSETVKISTILPENAGITWQDGDSYDDNPWYRAYKDRLNIEVSNDWVSNDYATKLNLNIADGNLPDVFFVNGSQLQGLIDADMIWDMTEIFDEYSSDLVKSYMETQQDTLKSGKRDGKLYGIPQLDYGLIGNTNVLWLRQDWGKELGVSEIKTVEDMEKVAKELQKKNGGYSIAENKSLGGMKIMATAWGAQPGIWVEQKDGKIGYGSVQPEMKGVLATYAKWYKEGLLSSEFTSMDQRKMFQEVINGKVGFAPGEQWWGWNPCADMVANQGPESVMDGYAVPTGNGEAAKTSILFSNLGYVVVNKKCQNPEAVMKLLNFYAYMMDESAGKEDKEFIDSLFNNAYPNIAFALRIINPETDYRKYELVTESLAKYQKGEEVDQEALGKDAVIYQNCVDWIENKTPASMGDWMQEGSPTSAYSIGKKVVDDETYIKDKFWGQQVPAIAKMGTTLDSILDEGFTKIIVGEEPLEYFDTLVSNWKAAGGDQVTKEVNEICK